MTQYVFQQFLSASRRYLGQHQPKAASSGSPPKLVRPEGSRFPLPERGPSTPYPQTALRPKGAT
jgi:hypothetical protein